jgi:hypothetical protein
VASGRRDLDRVSLPKPRYAVRTDRRVYSDA